MIRTNLINSRSNKSPKQKTVKNAAMALLAALIGFSSASCTTSHSKKPAGTEAVSAQNQELDDPTALQDIPAELRDAHKFDPASTLDQKTVQESDFYKIKQSIESNRAVLEAAWKEQERIEASVRSSLTAENQHKAALAKQEEEDRERKRQLAIEDFENNKDRRAKDASDADEEVKKLPTIKKSEVLWKGLED